MAKEEIGQSVAKAIVGTVGSGLLGVLLSVVAIRDWAVECLRSRPAEFIFGFLVSAAFGGAFTFFVYGAYARKKFDSLPKRAEIHERDERIRSLEAELRSRPTAERLEEARAALDERPTRAELDAERAVSASLRAELETRPTRDQWAAANDLVEQYKGEAERLRAADSDSLDSFSLAQLVLMQRVLRAMDEGRYLVARSGSSDSEMKSKSISPCSSQPIRLWKLSSRCSRRPAVISCGP